MGPELPAENVFGHSKKVRLLRESLVRLREGLGRPLDILDVGCGNGIAVTRFLPQPGDHVVGIDEHAESIRHAQQQFASDVFEFRQQRAGDIDAGSRPFDAIVLADVLEHLEEPQRLLDQSSALLLPAGAILVTIPNGWGPFELESWVSRLPLVGRASLRLVDLFVAFLNRYVFPDAWTRVVVSPDDVPYNLHSGHIQFFSRSQFLSMGQRSGLELRRFAHLSWLSGPYTNYLLAPSRRFCDWNARVADDLPAAAVSAWFLEFRKKGRTA